MRKKEITMSISKFLEYTEQSEFERVCNKLLKKKNFKTVVVASLALSFMIINVQAYAATPDLSGIDRLGNTLLGILQKGGYWVALTMGLVDVIKQVAKGGDGFGNIGRVVAKYVLIFAMLYFLPYLFDVVRDCFR